MAASHKKILPTIVFAAVLLFTPVTLIAQNKTVDSLLKHLATTKADTNRVITLNNIAFALYYTDYQKSLDYCKQANALTTKLNYLRGLAVNYHVQGIVYTFEDDYATALIKEQQAASLALKINDYLLLAKTYNAAGLAYSRHNDAERSLAAFNSAIEALKRTSDKSLNAAILHNMAVLYIEKKDYKRGLAGLFEAAELNIHHNNKQWLVQNYFWIGNVYYQQKQYQQALNYEAKAIAIAEPAHYYQPFVKALGVLGAINMALKKYTLAESELLQAEKLAKEKKITSEQLHILTSLVELYEHKHNLKMALVYQKTYQEHYQAIYNSEKTKLVAEYQARFEDKQKYIENELLKKEDLINHANIRQRNLMLAITLLGMVVLIGVSILTYVAYRNIKQKNAQMLLQHQQITLQNKQLENLNHLKDKLFSILAHDLRSPLATLKNILELSDAQLVTKAEEEAVRKSIMREVDQNSDLINNLLIWGRSQLGGFKISRAEFSVLELTNRVTALLKPDIDQKNITLKNNINANSIAFADKEMMEAVVRNLLNNAVKFTHNGGTITLTGIVQDNKIQIAITDTGIGMAPNQSSRLFKGDFYTEKGPLNPNGTGLGLQIYKEFIERNDGTIWVESEAGKGSTFYFTIPAVA
ncbi:MAG: tetratricopeptide repeat-containing sensor histidine kinase [Mucilaginibacter sp.]|nr:tetratricopeptide repeat-containing sensor histidine kinase [Mucilaginibacter sp.]